MGFSNVSVNGKEFYNFRCQGIPFRTYEKKSSLRNPLHTLSNPTITIRLFEIIRGVWDSFSVWKKKG